MSVYLVLGIVGLLVLAVSLLVGDVLDGVLDGALDGLGGDWFSTEVIGGFVSALGFGGAIAVSPVRPVRSRSRSAWSPVRRSRGWRPG